MCDFPFITTPIKITDCHCERSQVVLGVARQSLHNKFVYTNQYFIYIATNKNDAVLYTGVTNNLISRIRQHRTGNGSSFTKKYKIVKLVYYEVYADIEEAIRREKQIKGGSRRKKIDLIKSINPEFRDLYEEIVK